MAHPIRFVRGLTVGAVGAGVVAGAMLVGPAPLAEAAVPASAAVHFDVAAPVDPPPPPDPAMPRPAIGGPADDGSPLPPLSQHRHRHYYSHPMR